MLLNFEKLSKEEQQIFEFLKEYSLLINELNQVINVFNRISKTMKIKGLSHKNINESICDLLPLVASPFTRISQAVKECINYLNEQSEKLSKEDSVWHISSDIVESIFGLYKDRKSPNPLNGVTSYVLMLPLLTKSYPETGIIRLDFKEALECVFLRDIEKWSKDNLSENIAVKRRIKLNMAS
jgi:hypothetical protein